MPVWVVTGGSGFLGRHLLDRLAGEPAEVVAVGRNHPAGWPGRFVRADFDDQDAVERAVAALRPDVVFHLAGQTPPAQPEDFDRGNTRATVAWLDALRGLDRPVRLVLAGSAGELGPVPVEHLPVGEGWPCHPADPYGLSKHLATCAALASPPPVEAVVARIFNPIGPGLPGSQALGRFARDARSGDGAHHPDRRQPRRPPRLRRRPRRGRGLARPRDSGPGRAGLPRRDRAVALGRRRAGAADRA